MTTEEMLIAQNNLNQAKTNHILHLILSIITVGLWIPIWVIITLNNNSKKTIIENDIKGKSNFLYSFIQLSVAIGIIFLIISMTS